MAAPQAILRFPGLQQVRRWSYTLSHGITPGVATVEILPQFGIPPQLGTMQLAFASTLIEFRGCLIDTATVRRSPESGMVVALNILDRRWRWRFGEITGRYNVRLKSGKVDTETEKTPQQLATLLLKAMSESGYSVSELPNLSRPEVEWISANPAAELASLCESLGCRVVLGLNGTVAIRRLGLGKGLPNSPTKQTLDYGIDPPLRPDELKIVGGPTRFETKFRLEAVGIEVGGGAGQVVPIGELSYKPTDGWGYEALSYFGNVTVSTEARMLAQRCVYRWFRLKCTADRNIVGAFSIPGLEGQENLVEELWQVLPLESHRVQTSLDRDDVEQPLDSLVEGVYWNRQKDAQNVTAIRRYEGSFSVDTERGIVMFSEPVVKLATDGTLEEPELYLTIGHGVKRSASASKLAAMPLRFELSRQLPGVKLGTGPQILARDEVVRTVIGEYTATTIGPYTLTGIDANDSIVEQEGNYYLDAAQAEYQTLQTLDVQYAGILPIQPDGAVQQVSWSGGPQGGVTRASRNNEFSRVVPSWKERRMAEKQKVAQNNARKLLKLFGAGGSGGGPVR